MEEMNRLLGVAQGLAEASDDPASLKNALNAALNALGAVCDELKQLRKDYDELNEYVTRIDEDLSELELMHDEEAEYDKLFDGDEDEEDDEEDDETEDESDDEDIDDFLGKLFQKNDEQDDTDENQGNTSGLFMWKNDDKDE